MYLYIREKPNMLVPSFAVYTIFDYYFLFLNDITTVNALHIFFHICIVDQLLAFVPWCFQLIEITSCVEGCSSADNEDGLMSCIVKIADWLQVNLLFLHDGKWKLLITYQLFSYIYCKD